MGQGSSSVHEGGVRSRGSTSVSKSGVDSLLAEGTAPDGETARGGQEASARLREVPRKRRRRTGTPPLCLRVQAKERRTDKHPPWSEGQTGRGLPFRKSRGETTESVFSQKRKNQNLRLTFPCTTPSIRGRSESQRVHPHSSSTPWNRNSVISTPLKITRTTGGTL